MCLPYVPSCQSWVSVSIKYIDTNFMKFSSNFAMNLSNKTFLFLSAVRRSGNKLDKFFSNPNHYKTETRHPSKRLHIFSTVHVRESLWTHLEFPRRKLDNRKPMQWQEASELSLRLSPGWSEGSDPANNESQSERVPLPLKDF